MNKKYLRSIGTSERSIKEAEAWLKANKVFKNTKNKGKRNHKPKPTVIIESKGECEITTFLNLHKIWFVPEKKFKGLVGDTGSSLRFDFYLPNEKVLIEYDGAHHFRKTSYSKNLSHVQHHDRLKTEWAANNNMPLIRITKKDVNNLAEIIFTVLDMRRNKK